MNLNRLKESSKRKKKSLRENDKNEYPYNEYPDFDSFPEAVQDLLCDEERVKELKSKPFDGFTPDITTSIWCPSCEKSFDVSLRCGRSGNGVGGKHPQDSFGYSEEKDCPHCSKTIGIHLEVGVIGE